MVEPLNYEVELRRSVAQYLRTIAEADIRARRTPMQYAQQPTTTLTGRYCILRLDVGLDNKRLMQLLDPTVLYQIIPWDTGKQRPQVYLDRRYVAIEAPLPPAVVQNYEVRLCDLTESRHNGRVCVLGPNEAGVTVSLGLEDIIHVLIGGETGAGKTWTMRSLAYQFANGRNRIVLADGKRGDGLAILNGLPAQVGPLAADRYSIVNALGWVYDEMLARYDTVTQRGGMAWQRGEEDTPPHILVFFDEFQVYRDDVAVMGLLHSLVTMGRSARIHIIAGTQKPTVKMFGRDAGGATRDQFGTRIAHWVESYQASNAIVGDNEPRADYLMPRGDAYILGYSGSYPVRERVQIAYVSEWELQCIGGGQPALDAWPIFDASNLGGNGVGRPATEFDNQQLACGIYAAQQGWGRDRLQQLLAEKDVAVPGSEPADRLLVTGQEIDDLLSELNRANDKHLLDSNRSAPPA